MTEGARRIDDGERRILGNEPFLRKLVEMSVAVCLASAPEGLGA